MKHVPMLLLTTLLFLTLDRAAAMDASAGAAPGGAFTSTTTHIEADLWSLLKIERSEPDRPRVQPADNKPAAISLNWFGLLRLDKYPDEKKRPRALHLGFAEVPFFQAWQVNRQGAFIWKDEVINWYWLAVIDGMAEKNYEKQNALGGNTVYARLAVLDAPLIFTGYRLKFEAPQRTYWEALDLPLSTTVSHLTDKDKETWKVLNLPLLWVYYSDRDSSSSETTVLGSLATLYTSERKAAAPGKPAENEWSVLDLPLVTLLKGKGRGPARELTLLDGCTVYDEKLFFLWRRRIEDGERSGTQTLKLPFLGPVFATWSDDAGHHGGIFPKLFARSYPKSLKTIF